MKFRDYPSESPLNIVSNQEGRNQKVVGFIPNNQDYYTPKRPSMKTVRKQIRQQFKPLNSVSSYRMALAPREVRERAKEDQFARMSGTEAGFDFNSIMAVERLKTKEEQQVLMMLDQAQKRAKIILDYVSKQGGLNLTEEEKQKILSKVNEVFMYQTQLFFKGTVGENTVDNLGRPAQALITKLLQSDLPAKIRDLEKGLTALELNIVNALKTEISSIHSIGMQQADNETSSIGTGVSNMTDKINQLNEFGKSLGEATGGGEAGVEETKEPDIPDITDNGASATAQSQPVKTEEEKKEEEEAQQIEEEVIQEAGDNGEEEIPEPPKMERSQTAPTVDPGGRLTRKNLAGKLNMTQANKILENIYGYDKKTMEPVFILKANEPENNERKDLYYHWTNRDDVPKLARYRKDVEKNVEKRATR